MVAPAFEELVVRAYVQTEVTYLAGNPIIAILAGALLQTSYHFYQGWFAAIACDMPIFIVFSIYYQLTNRITPTILAHIAWDVCVVLGYR